MDGIMADRGGSVARRMVFYIPGFDPFHPRRYRELYRKEGALQAKISGYQLALTPSAKGEAFGWHVTSTIEKAEIDTSVEVLIWHDLVKAAMPDGILATYGQLVRTAWIYFRSGAIWPLVGLRKGPMVTSFYPVFILLGQLGFALILGWFLAKGLGHFIPLWLALIPGLALVWALLRLFRRLDGKIFAHYLMHDFAYVAQHDGAYSQDLEARLTEFGARIRAALHQDFDEVLVVGHSSGVHLGVSVLADLLRQDTKGADQLAFLSLGQAVPMVSFLPKATRLRRDLQSMSEQEQIPWVDVTAPSDGCTFALCDPVAVTGVARDQQRWPLVLSAAFSQTLSPQKRKELKRRYFRLHFQYLCAFDALPKRKDAYDYFKITAGPMRLWDRFHARAPSKSRITRAASRYRGTEE